MKVRTTVLVLATAVFACGGGPSAPGDSTSPEVTIEFPVAESYDLDDDGLVDVRIRLDDESSGIDAESVVVESSRPLGPAGGGGTDLLAGFRLVSRDASRIVLEETTDALLPSGEITLTARVQDRADNESVATRVIDLPAGEFHKRLGGGNGNASVDIYLNRE